MFEIHLFLKLNSSKIWYLSLPLKVIDILVDTVLVYKHGLVEVEYMQNNLFQSIDCLYIL